MNEVWNENENIEEKLLLKGQKMMTDNLWSIVVSKTCFSKPIQKEKFGSQVCTTRLKTTWTKVKMEYKLNIKNSGNFAIMN